VIWANTCLLCKESCATFIPLQRSTAVNFFINCNIFKAYLVKLENTKHTSSMGKYNSSAAALSSSLRFLTRMSYFNTNGSLKYWARRVLTCRLQCNANGKRSFNVVKDVLICGERCTYMWWYPSNPGPGKSKPLPKYPCGECYKAVRNNQDAILCVGCNKWSHAIYKCLQMSDTVFQYYLRKPDIELTCLQKIREMNHSTLPPILKSIKL